MHASCAAAILNEPREIVNTVHKPPATCHNFSLAVNSCEGAVMVQNTLPTPWPQTLLCMQLEMCACAAAQSLCHCSDQTGQTHMHLVYSQVASSTTAQQHACKAAAHRQRDAVHHCRPEHGDNKCFQGTRTSTEHGNSSTNCMPCWQTRNTTCNMSSCSMVKADLAAPQHTSTETSNSDSTGTRNAR